MVIRLNKVVFLILSLLLISCNGDAQKTRVKEKVLTNNEGGIDFFDKKFSNILYRLVIDESTISDHPQKSYLDCESEGYFTIHYIPKTERLRHYWNNQFFEKYDINNVDLERDDRKIGEVLKNNMNEYEIFSYKINNEYLDSHGQCTVESVFAKKNTFAHLYYYNQTDKTWELFKNISSETLPPYFNSDFFLNNFSEYFNSETKNTDSFQSTRSNVNPIKADQWDGKYNVSIDYGKLDENSEMSIDYRIEIKSGRCTFSGMGYKTYFTDLCEIEKLDDKLVIKYLKSIDGDGFSDHSNLKILGEIIYKSDNYYVNSPIIADSKWNYNTKIKLTKKL